MLNRILAPALLGRAVRVQLPFAASDDSMPAYLRTTPYRLGETVRPLAFPDVAVPVAPLFGR